ncbi:MAG: hypothetical protein AW07_04212 [Candidatus Accumulibacter sp. SK-11]|nr:MAG: hypothetical protein AW07_04212 [Candidatus Accumulibacter sp. SK-11]
MPMTSRKTGMVMLMPSSETVTAVRFWTLKSSTMAVATTTSPI